MLKLYSNRNPFECPYITFACNKDAAREGGKVFYTIENRNGILIVG